MLYRGGMADASPPTKRDLLLRLLDAGKVMVQLDARRSGVVVPEHVSSQCDLKLNLSHRFAGPMEVGEEMVRAELSFGGRPFVCELPLSAIYAVVSHTTHEFFFFPSDAPTEALAALAELLGKADTDAASGSQAPRRRPRLEALDGGEGGEAPHRAAEVPEGEGAPKSSARSRAPHLRVVK